MTRLGTQTLVDLYGCDPLRLNDPDGIREAMLEAARRAGATIVTNSFHSFSPHGVSGVVILAESHFAIHTWPEHGFAALDLFTCGSGMLTDTCFPYLIAALGSTSQKTTVVCRGEMRGGARFWPHTHKESVGPGRELTLRMNGPWLFEGEESFPSLGGMKQRTQIGDFSEFGRALVLDGQVQLSEAIDSLYTTALVYPAALASRSRANWLIVGGGDGAAAREALRFRDTESVTLVDISPMVIAQTQLLIPSFWQGAQHDPRLRIECRDAWQVLREKASQGERSDIVLFDLTDPENEDFTPFSESSADHLYTHAAFELAARNLRAGGFFVAQVQELSILRWKDHLRLRQLLRRSFRHVWSYRVQVELFGYWESFLIASNDAEPASPIPLEPVEPKIERLCGASASNLWSTEWHRSLFALPPELIRAIAP